MKITIFEDIGKANPIGHALQKRVNEHLKTIDYMKYDVTIQMSSAFNDQGVYHLAIMVVQIENRIRTS